MRHAADCGFNTSLYRVLPKTWQSSVCADRCRPDSYRAPVSGGRRFGGRLQEDTIAVAAFDRAKQKPQLPQTRTGRHEGLAGAVKQAWGRGGSEAHEAPGVCTRTRKESSGG